MPRSKARCTISRVVSRSTLEPSVSHDPSDTSLTWSPLRPRARYSMARILPRGLPRKAPIVNLLADARARRRHRSQLGRTGARTPRRPARRPRALREEAGRHGGAAAVPLPAARGAAHAALAARARGADALRAGAGGARDPWARLRAPPARSVCRPAARARAHARAGAAA